MASKNQQEVATLAETRVGRSLVLYFKPVLVIPPHRTPFPARPLFDRKKTKKTQSDNEKKNAFRVLKFKKQASEASESQPETDLNPPPKDWISMVVSLLKACRGVSAKMRRARGTAVYQDAVQGRGKLFGKARGNILDQVSQFDQQESPEDSANSENKPKKAS